MKGHVNHTERERERKYRSGRAFTRTGIKKIDKEKHRITLIEDGENRQTRVRL